MSKKQDQDILVLKAARRALDKSTSPKMLKANLGFLFDHYIVNPSKGLPDHLKTNPERRREVG